MRLRELQESRDQPERKARQVRRGLRELPDPWDHKVRPLALPEGGLRDILI